MTFRTETCCRTNQAAGIVSIQGSLLDAATGSVTFLAAQHPATAPAAGHATTDLAALPHGDTSASADAVKQPRRKKRKAEKLAAAAAAEQQPAADGAAVGPGAGKATMQQPAMQPPASGGAAAEDQQHSPGHEMQHRKHKRRKDDLHPALPNGGLEAASVQRVNASSMGKQKSKHRHKQS